MVTPRSLNWILTACLFLAACQTSASSSPTPASVSENTPLPESAFLTPAPPMPGLSAEQVRNAKYQLGFTDALRVVQLSNGVYQQGAPGDPDYIEVRMTDFIALGDINKDGVNEAAALVSENYGGSGVFVFLALYVDKNDTPEFLTSIFVDDRPMIEAVGFENGLLSLSVTTHAAEDPFCCPTLRNERHYRLVGNQLDMADYVTFTPDGRPRTITIDTPADGTEVSGVAAIKGKVAIAPFENTLVYRIYDFGGVELSAGAVQVTTTDMGQPGTFDANIPLGNILSGALIRIEIQDLSAKDGSLLAMDSVELVVK